MYFILIVMFAALTSCEKSNQVYTIEGKWLWSPSENRSDANTMFEFINGRVYTSYANCLPNPCTDADWNALDSTDRIPGFGNYTIEGDTLVWDGTPKAVTFECDGGKLHLDGSFSQLWRLSSKCQ